MNLQNLSDVIPNGLEKYMAFMINKNLLFIDGMQFMSSSLEKLVKNLANNDFKYLIEKCSSKNLELLKEKDAYSYKYVGRFERFNEEKLPNKRCFYRSLKDRTTGDNDKKLSSHISDEEYLTCNEILNKFDMKNTGDFYHDRYF